MLERRGGSPGLPGTLKLEVTPPSNPSNEQLATHLGYLRTRVNELIDRAWSDNGAYVAIRNWGDDIAADLRSVGAQPSEETLTALGDAHDVLVLDLPRAAVVRDAMPFQHRARAPVSALAGVPAAGPGRIDLDHVAQTSFFDHVAKDRLGHRRATDVAEAHEQYTNRHEYLLLALPIITTLAGCLMAGRSTLRSYVRVECTTLSPGTFTCPCSISHVTASCTP